jgi:hypothetical protein
MFGSFRDLAFLGVAAGTGVALDPDAQSYITAVETVDGQALEAGVRAAINDFVVGCKADGIWNAIKASCILAGARTLNGALVPLVGTAPTNSNFASGDYNRKTGLTGNGTTKWLNSNRNNNADPRNNQHMSINVTVAASNVAVYMGAGPVTNEAGSTNVGRNGTAGTFFRSRISITYDFSNHTASMIGVSRSSSTAFTARANSTSQLFTIDSEASYNGNIAVFGSTNGQNKAAITASFYSIGESLDLALLDARVTDLINAFGAAIP